MGVRSTGWRRAARRKRLWSQGRRGPAGSVVMGESTCGMAEGSAEILHNPGTETAVSARSPQETSLPGKVSRAGERSNVPSTGQELLLGEGAAGLIDAPAPHQRRGGIGLGGRRKRIGLGGRSRRRSAGGSLRSRSGSFGSRLDGRRGRSRGSRRGSSTAAAASTTAATSTTAAASGGGAGLATAGLATATLHDEALVVAAEGVAEEVQHRMATAALLLAALLLAALLLAALLLAALLTAASLLAASRSRASLLAASRGRGTGRAGSGLATLLAATRLHFAAGLASLASGTGSRLRAQVLHSPQAAQPSQRRQANRSFRPENKSQRLQQLEQPGAAHAAQGAGAAAQAAQGAGAPQAAHPPSAKAWPQRAALNKSAPRTIVHFIEKTLLYLELGCLHPGVSCDHKPEHRTRPKRDASFPWVGSPMG